MENNSVVKNHIIIEVNEKMEENIIIRKNETKYLLLIILAICFLATGGIFVKLSSLPPINTGFYRILFSIPILFPFAIKKVKTVSKKELMLLLLSGAFLAGDLTLWNISFYFTTVANANLLANLVPITIIPVSYFLFKEKIHKNFLIGMGVIGIGIFFLMIGKVQPSIKSFQGDFMAFSTSIFYASFMLTVYKLRDKISSTIIMFVSAFGSIFVLAIVIGLTEGYYIPKNFHEIYPLLCLAIISQICGQGLLAFCLGRVNASLSSILVLSQPIIAAIYSYIIFSERLSIIEVMGIIISLVGIYIAKKNF